MKAEYVIVGSGSAGSALAYRLSEAGHSVIVIEAGGSDAGPFIQMPAALSYPMGMARYDWGMMSEPEPHLNNRRFHAARGKVIGGSSSINGMVYVRGHARDYDTWGQMGASGWSFADVLPYFKRMETWHGPDPSDWRGTDGPLHITRGPRLNPLYNAFIEAGAQAGYQTTDDYNGEKQEGFGPMEQTVWKGRRWSAANAYLRPAMRRFKCRLVKGLARKVVIQDRRATGVEISTPKGIKIIKASREVILSASAYNSPKLLMLSGIGPGTHLRDHGIEVIADRPGVGQNLQDHLEVFFQMASSQPVTLYKHWNMRSKAMIGARWLVTKRGIGASNQFESAGFIRSRAGLEYPDIQYHFLPIAIAYNGTVAAQGHGFQAHVGPNRSPSRGTITLKNGDPEVAPEIRMNYMSDEQDWIDFRTAIRLTREVFAQPAFAPFVKSEIMPGADVTSDEALDEFVRENAESAYHACGTCRIGNAQDKSSVVDPQARVIGVDGLRVADSSIFPTVTNGNLNGPSIMAGEKVSDHILGKSLPRDERAAWVHPKWQTEQR